MDPFLTVKNLCIDLHSKSILSDICFTASQNEFISLIGKNGAGKTTFFKGLCGLIPIKGGAIQFEGKDLSRFTQRQRAQLISYLPQKLHITYPITVADFILMGRTPYVSSWWGYSQNDKKAVDDAMQILQLESFASRFMHELSGGEQQRVLIASTLAQKAKIILLDEPTAFLDPVQQEFLCETLQSVKNTLNACIIITSHHLSLTAKYSDRILGLRDGRLIFNGNVSQFSSESHIEKIYGKELTL